MSGSSEHQVFHSATRIVNVTNSIPVSQLVLSGRCSSVTVEAASHRDFLEEAWSLGRAEEQRLDVAAGFRTPSSRRCADVVGGVVVFRAMTR